MGGFEGGDEAGFWEVEEDSSPYGISNTLNYKQYDILEQDENYLIKVDNFDIGMTFVPQNSNQLTIEGCKSDIIYKAYESLVKFTDDMEIIEFFQNHKVVVKTLKTNDETILGALFILLTKDVCNLVLDNSELEEIASKIQTDIKQFL
jgi:hypothetical protein